MQIDAENIITYRPLAPNEPYRGMFVTPTAYGNHAHPFHYIDKVAEFHQRFKVEPGNMELRKALILEELKELQQAVKQDSRKDIVDGLCDVIYVVAGTQLAQRFGAVNTMWWVPFTKEIAAQELESTCAQIEQPVGNADAMHPNSLAVMIKACHYIADVYNIDIWTNFMLVHENNMSKTWTEEQVKALPADCAYGITPTEDGRYIIKSPAGKVLKPPGHTAPTLVL